MASGFGYTQQPAQVAPSASAVGQALLQRRMATNPANAQPGMPNLTGNTMQGQLPQIGRRPSRRLSKELSMRKAKRQTAFDWQEFRELPERLREMRTAMQTAYARS